MAITTLHLTNAYHPTSGGIRTFYQALIEAGNRSGRRVCLVVPGEVDGQEHVGSLGRIHFVRSPRAPGFDRRYRVMLPYQYIGPWGRRLRSIIDQECPEVIEICDKHTLPYLAALLRKLPSRRPRPVLIGLSCERFDDSLRAFVSGGRAASRFARWYMRHIYGPPFDAHIAVSDYVAGELRQTLFDRAESFIRVAGMGVDTTTFSPARRRASARAALLRQGGWSEGSTILLYAGRLSPEKGVDRLLDAMERLVAAPRGYRLVVAGDGPSRDALRQQAAMRLRNRVLFCGNLGRDALADAYANADVFIHPNGREPFGIGPLEAMASGVPVVVPASGGVLSYASPGNAWLTDGSADSMAEAVSAAARGDAAKVLAARATAERFAWDAAAARYFDAYDAIHTSALAGRLPGYAMHTSVAV